MIGMCTEDGKTHVSHLTKYSIDTPTAIFHPPFQSSQPSPSFPRVSHSSILLVHLSNPSVERHTELVQTKTRQDTQSNRQRLLRPNRARDRATGQNNTGQQAEFDAVGLAVLDAVAAKAVEETDGAAGDDRWHAACAHVTHGAAACGQAGQDVGDVSEGLEWLRVWGWGTHSRGKDCGCQWINCA